MASLHPHRSGWRVHYRVLGLQIAEGPYPKPEAQKRQAEVEYQISKGIDPRTGRRMIAGTGPTLAEGLAMFGDWSAKRQRARLTLKRDFIELERFVPCAPDYVAAIAPEHVRAFLDTRAALCASSYNKALFAIKAFCKAMRELGHIAQDPTFGIRSRRVPRQVPDILTLDEVARLLAAFDSFDRPFALFVATTGCRRGEACSLLWEDIDLPRAVVRSPKEKHDKVLMLPEGLCSIIAQLPRNSSFVFPNRFGRQRVNNLSKFIKDAARRAGLDPARVHWHALRHTVATYLITEEPPAVVQQLLGHQQISTTMGYVHMAGQHLAKAAAGSLSTLFDKVSNAKCVTEMCNNGARNERETGQVPSDQKARISQRKRPKKGRASRKAGNS